MQHAANQRAAQQQQQQPQHHHLQNSLYQRNQTQKAGGVLPSASIFHPNLGQTHMIGTHGNIQNLYFHSQNPQLHLSNAHQFGKPQTGLPLAVLNRNNGARTFYGGFGQPSVILKVGDVFLYSFLRL